MEGVSFEDEGDGVECLPGNLECGKVLGSEALFCESDVDRFVASIDFIAQDGEPEGVHGGADLVESSSPEGGFDEGKAAFAPKASQGSGGGFGGDILWRAGEREGRVPDR